MARPYFLAFLVFAAIAVPSLAVRAALKQRSEELVDIQMRLTADQVARRLESFVEARLSPIRILQEQWRANAVRDEQGFRQQVAGLRQHVDGLVAVNWIDPQGVIRWVVPAGPNAAARGKSVREHPVAGPILAAAERTRTLRLSPPLTLFQGGRGFTAYGLLQDPTRQPAGYVNAVFRTQPLVELCLGHELREGFGLKIQDGVGLGLVYETSSEPNERYAVSRPVLIGDRTWMLRLSPSPTVLAPLSTRAPDYLALAGFLLGLALAWTSAAFLKARKLKREQEVQGARLRLILEATTDLVGMSDAQGGVSYLNRAGRRHLEIGEDESLEGKTIADFHPPEVAARVLNEAVPAVIAHGVWESETVLRARSGREFPVSQVLLGHRGAAGELTHMSTIARDLSDAHRRAAEHEALLIKLQEKQRLETMGTLAGGIAHDFNNLLMIVRGFAEVTRVQVGAEPGGPRENLDQILVACDQAKALIAQILTFARRSPSEPEPLELVPLVEGVASLLRATLPLGVAMRLKLGEGGAVYADRSQVQQVVMNLCVNAIHALGDEGVLEVGIRPLNEARAGLPALLPGKAVEIYVFDDGAGMPEDVRARVFDPFFTTRRGSGGTGLGLSVVHGILDSHGGGIEVESEEGTGTTMRVFLPALRLGPPPESPPEPASPSSPAAPGLERVLVVDDQESVRQVLIRGLELEGFHVTTATTPEQALELVKNAASPFSLVLTDLTFESEEVDGVSLARSLEAVSPGLPVVLMTGSTDRNPRELQAAGIREVLLKPFSMTTLGEVVKENLKKSV